MLKIAIVENEDLIAEKLSKIVIKLGYKVVGRAIGAEDLYKLLEKQEKPNLILMDIDINGNIDGTELAFDVKSKYEIPSVFISGYTESEILEDAGNSKPLGFIVKPYKHKDIEVTLALIETKFKQEVNQKLSERTIKFNEEYEYKLDVKQIYKNGKLFDLTNNEQKFVDILAVNNGTTVPFPQIFMSVWGTENIDMTSVRNLVKRIRDKMGIDIIHSVRGIGYRLK